MERKGFTLVELLVVIAIIALLMGILMPALARVRQIAYRLYCGTNLSGIGKAMLIYSNDYEDEMPRAGGRNSGWAANIANWRNVDRRTAFGLNADFSGGAASISSCFYLLVKYAEVTPKSFMCKGHSGVQEFKPSDYGLSGVELIDLWDFGNDPRQHCSYSYHMPLGGVYALTTSAEPGMAVAADPNPWLAIPGMDARLAADWTNFNPAGDREAVKLGNAQTHQDDGQNVLFMDGHTSFEKQSFCAVDDDNVYTRWVSVTDKKRGAQLTGMPMQPFARTDSLLVMDGTGTGGGGGGTR
jgi:prepilin-type N-terminal cleavage/methylation domain-containing protein